MPVGLETKTLVQQCQIVVFSWDYNSSKTTTESQLGESTPFDVSNYLISASMTKTMEAPAGQFQFQLANDRDWKEVIKKGMWVIIYTSNDGDLAISPNRGDITVGDSSKKVRVDSISTTKLKSQKSKIRMIGRVDTVRAQGSTGAERGEFEVNFVISGRNYGAIYEDTEIWHNQVLYDQSLLNAAQAKINASDIKTVDGLLSTLHDLFLAPDKFPEAKNKLGSLTSIARQWLWPSKLMSALDISLSSSSSYYGNIPDLLNFSKTPASYPVESPTALLNGVAWSRLKAHSIEPYHELFVELNDDGQPRLNFRLMPLIVNKRSVSKYKDIADLAGDSLFYGKPVNGQVELDDLDIISWDLGEDDHTRYNMFWSTLNTSLVNIQTSNGLIQDNSPETGFPRVNQNSVRRHGFRKLFSEVNANIILGSEQSNLDLVRQFNEYALEVWERSHEYESGTMTIIGNNDIKLGKTVLINPDSPYNSNKIFYIEGYDETFTVGGRGETEWTQNLFLTRGIEKSVLEDSQLIENRQNPYDDAGDFTDK